MSDHQNVPEAEKFDPAKAGGLPKLSLFAGIAGIAGSLIVALVSREQFAYSWLFAFAYFFIVC